MNNPLKLPDPQKYSFSEAVTWRGSKSDFVNDLFPLIRDMVLEAAAQECAGEGGHGYYFARLIRAMKGTP